MEKHRRVKKPLKKLLNSAALSYTPLERKCLDSGIRMTPARSLILRILEKANSHLTIEDVYRCALKADEEISLSTIYSNIKLLVDFDIVAQRHFQPKHTYCLEACEELCDQLIDVESGRVVEFRNEVLDKLKADIAQEFGFSAEDCRVEIYSRSCTARTHKQ